MTEKSARTKTTETTSDVGVEAPKYALPEGLFTLLDGEDREEALEASGLSAEQAIEIYRWMLTVRTMDTRMVNLQRQGRIAFYGPITGQEAASVASGYAATKKDWVFPALREAVVAFMRGLTLDDGVAQLMGNENDRCKGRQMPCHYTLKEGNYYAMSSVIATQLSHATGAAHAAQISGDDAVMLTYIGDGGTSENDFHAALNWAGVFKLPVVFICQNNHWAITVHTKGQTKSDGYAVKAVAYGFDGLRVDGNDALAVYKATHDAIEKARSGGGPTLIEAVTYRMRGHTTSDDPRRYRDEEEVELWRTRDPIDRLRTFLVERDLWDDVQEQALAEEVKGQVDAAVKRQEQVGPPDEHTLVEDVFATVPAGLEEQFEELVESGGFSEPKPH
jgi:TPP-dependent pyruvate/acetoin dehydrogenase alpha subunit